MHRETELKKKVSKDSECFHERPSGLYLYPSRLWPEIAADLRRRCRFGTQHAVDGAVDGSAGSDADLGPLRYGSGS